MNAWTLYEARARFSELVRAAAREPQQITVQGKPVAVLISQEHYKDLIADQPTLVEFLRRSPIVGTTLSFKRNKSRTRQVDLEGF